jgi:hypothetical protein
VNGSGSDPTPRSDSLILILFSFLPGKSGLPLRPEDGYRVGPGPEGRPGPLKIRVSPVCMDSDRPTLPEGKGRWTLIPRWINRQEDLLQGSTSRFHGMREFYFYRVTRTDGRAEANRLGTGRGSEREIKKQTPMVGVRIGSRL